MKHDIPKKWSVEMCKRESEAEGMAGSTPAPGSAPNQSNAVAIRTLDTTGRMVSLHCPFCPRQWTVRGRGSATGFIVAAANHHAMVCDLKHRAPNAERSDLP